MFTIGEEINTDIGEKVCILQLISSRNGFSVYRVRIDHDIFIMRWFDKELYEGHFKIINGLCKQEWPREFVLPIKVFRVWDKDEYGFGYVEPFVSEEYCDSADFFRGSCNQQAVSFMTYQAMLQACLNIAASVQKALLRGCYFRDGIHPGHYKIHPDTGEIFVIGAEELFDIYDHRFAKKSVQYSAPEYIDTKKSSIESEYFSLAILLYRLIFIDHPFDGALWEKEPIVTQEAEQMFYGSKAVFHFDPNNESNRPTGIYAPNACSRWKIMPLELRNAFTRVFTEGIRNPEKRLSAKMWISTLIKCRNKLFV